jgi:hypothetical protein
MDRMEQKSVSKAMGVSLGMTNKAVRKLEEASAVEAGPRGLRVLAPGRILNLWTAERRFRNEIWRSFRIDDLEEAGRSLPPSVILTGFAAWVRLSRRRPAEYGRIHFYVTSKLAFDSWVKFRENQIRKTNPNIFALSVDDPHLISTSSRGVACVPQVYVDIYAADGPEYQPFLRDIISSFPSLAVV